MILYKICRGKLTNNNHWIQLFDLVQTILEHILSICIKMLQSLNIFVQVFFNSNGFANTNIQMEKRTSFLIYCFIFQRKNSISHKNFVRTLKITGIQQHMMMWSKRLNISNIWHKYFEEWHKIHLFLLNFCQVVSFKAIISWTEHLVPILLSFYIGSWSDHFGRKPFLALCMAGKMVAALCNLLNAIFLDQWNRWVWLATVMPIQNISGGYLCFIMMIFSFIADNSTPRQKYMIAHKNGIT